MAEAKRKGGGKPKLRRQDKISEWRRNHKTKRNKSGKRERRGGAVV